MQGANISGVINANGYQLPFTGINTGCDLYLTIHGHQCHLQAGDKLNERIKK